MTDECIDQICSQPSLCIEHYYQQSEFLYERKLWAWVYVYNPLISMLYTHDHWASFSTSAIILMVQEMVTGICVSLGVPFIPGRIWDPGDIAFILFFELVGITLGMAIIMITSAPRMVRCPYEEIQQIGHDYSVGWNNDDAVFHYKESNYHRVRNKYYLQMALVIVASYASALLIYADPDPHRFDQHWVRVDWLSFVFLQSVLLLSFSIWNWTDGIEIEIIWKKNRMRYLRLYGLWATVLAMLVIPGLYMYLPGKISVLFGICMIVILLAVVGGSVWYFRTRKHET